VAEHKQEESFRVIDKRPFTAEGELRPDVVAEQEREARLEAVKEKTLEEAVAAQKPAVSPAEVPKKSIPFDNLVRMIAQNAAMVLGGYADPRTGQPVIDPEAARELIDMLDALHEKTKGNLAPEEDSTLLDLLGKLKMTFLEVNQAMAAEMAKMQAQGKTRG
jgi:HD superfamily phosphodiesterase